MFKYYLKTILIFTDQSIYFTFLQNFEPNMQNGCQALD